LDLTLAPKSEPSKIQDERQFALYPQIIFNYNLNTMQTAFIGTQLPASRPASSSRPRSALRSAGALKPQAFFNLGSTKTAEKKKEVVKEEPKNLLNDVFSSFQKDDDTVGFRFDPSMQRWVRAPHLKGSDRLETTVQPLSGAAYTVWPVMHQYLTSKKLKTIDQDTALALQKKGAYLVDVRLGMDFEKEHATGAVSVPLFRITAGNEQWDKIKRVVMAGLNMRATERDPAFIENMIKAVGGNKRKKVIIMCSVGGTLDTVVRVASTGKKTETDKDRAFGRETRSLKACYELMRAGFTDVVHLEGGLCEWRHEGYPMEP
jgi:rhodanese-related sulfurtransferase